MPAAARPHGLGLAGHPDIEASYEFFPPKTEKMEENLWASIARLAPLKPRFVSVTYGAGGTTRERTHATVVRILKDTKLIPAAHLTCVGASRGEVIDVADRYWEAGIRHIVALRGDAPEGDGTYVPHPDGFHFATDLVAGLKRAHDFEISVAAYPETHPGAQSAAADIDNLKRKVDEGASRAITQFFFDSDVYFRFMDKVHAAGIDVPIVPGILPVTNFAQVTKFAGMCGAKIPDGFAQLFEGLDEDPETRRLVAATAAAEQCRALYDGGVREFHFYTLNRADLAYAISHILGLRPQPEAEAQP
ncbi:MAG: methylenetetrahydrofolate reductase (NADPH) [Alphaproteobacteria bacterium]|jgi:methylenetetrahydrofolate reductase (NADPH)